MNELELKYGCNPNQKPAKVFSESGELPFEVLNGKPGYINLLDALNGWQLVRELREATNLPAAASFKHVSPAGAAVGLPLDEVYKKIYFADEENISAQAAAYIRARGADRMSSYGDFAILSDECDESTANYLKREVSDGVIAPSYSPKALEILKAKRKGTYLILKMNENYQPESLERKQVFGVTFEQLRNDIKISEECLKDIPTKNKNFTDSAKRDLLIALITLKYTQSNSVCYAKDGQAIGIGAGQQSRVHCTRLAGNKADFWFLRQSPQVLNLPFKPDVKRPDRDNAIDVYIGSESEDLLDGDNWKNVFTERPKKFTDEEKKSWLKNLKGVSLASDAFFPFGDNIERAHKSGVEFIAQSGGSIRDDNVIETCDKYGITMAFSHIRLFHH
ncbi:MAG: phosphoribosylaminoimidazolecarboxamide formyltransferase [Selenomonadaceae bacterium]|nr:phosphoribosylaminoimidazolecarboxamide formyltransferase [Selenomonadaceae bacterium]